MKNIMKRTNYRTETGQLVYTDGNRYFTCEMVPGYILVDNKPKKVTYHEYNPVEPPQNLVTHPRSLKS